MRNRMITLIILGLTVLSLVLVSSGVWAAEQTALSLPSERVSAEAKAKGSAGAQACADCHIDKYNDYRASGHPKKLRPAAEARAWGIPLPEGYDWKDISYVFGGAGWKARIIDRRGISSPRPDRTRTNLEKTSITWPQAAG